MYYLRYIKYLVFVVLIINQCSLTGTDDKNVTINPVKISYNTNVEEKVQEKWNRFLADYNNLKPPRTLEFNPASSYLERVSFQRPYPVVFSEGLNLNNEDDCIEKALQFYSLWEELFGCKSENLEYYNSNINSGWDEFSVRFIQTAIKGKHWDFVQRHMVYFAFTGDGRIRSIQSDLIPDINIDKPVDYNKEKMMNNIIGYTYEYWDWTGSKTHTYTRDDTYNFKHEYHIYDKTDGLIMYIYALKGINAGLITFYCHPESGEIIHIEENVIF